MASQHFVLVLLSLAFSLAASCSCFNSSIYQDFCSAGIVVQGRVLAKIDNCPGSCHPIEDQFRGRIVYIVKSLKLFKGQRPEDDTMFLETAVNGALCGIDLPLDEEFIFFLPAAQSSPGACPPVFYSVGLCNRIIPVKTASAAEIGAISGAVPCQTI